MQKSKVELLIYRLAVCMLLTVVFGLLAKQEREPVKRPWLPDMLQKYKLPIRWNPIYNAYCLEFTNIDVNGEILYIKSPLKYCPWTGVLLQVPATTNEVDISFELEIKRLKSMTASISNVSALQSICGVPSATMVGSQAVASDRPDFVAVCVYTNKSSLANIVVYTNSSGSIWFDFVPKISAADKLLER